MLISTKGYISIIVALKWPVATVRLYNVVTPEDTVK